MSTKTVYVIVDPEGDLRFNTEESPFKSFAEAEQYLEGKLDESYWVEIAQEVPEWFPMRVVAVEIAE